MIRQFKTFRTLCAHPCVKTGTSKSIPRRMRKNLIFCLSSLLLLIAVLSTMETREREGGRRNRKKELLTSDRWRKKALFVCPNCRPVLRRISSFSFIFVGFSWEAKANVCFGVLGRSLQKSRYDFPLHKVHFADDEIVRPLDQYQN